MTKWLICILLLTLFGCSNQLGDGPEELVPDLSQYPHWFFDDGKFNGVFIIDSEADPKDRETTKLLIEELQRYDPSIGEDLIREYPAYADLTGKNAILIGSCSQEPMNRFANLYLDCLSMLEEQVLIRIVNHQGSWLLFIVGYDTERTRDAVTMLREHKSYPLQGPGVEVVREGESFRVGAPR